MSATRHERLRDLFLRACELTGAGRREFVVRECSGDEELRTDLEALLAEDDKGQSGAATSRLVAGIERAAADRTLELDDPRAAYPDTRQASIPGYRIVRELGSGGAGVVYEAYQEKMNRNVALKLLATRLAFSDRAVRRFELEAWIAGKLNHPNIVQVHERGTWQGTSYYSMELVRGGSLADVIDRMRRDGQDDRFGLDFGSREYLDWAIRQIVLTAHALHHAHERGVIHRDVKPMNLLVDPGSSQVKLADFGIAIDADVTRLTSDGQAIGTLRYMSPEQLSGRGGEIDARSDVYSLGVTLFELLTLEHPFRGETIERYIDSVMTGESRRPSRLNNRVGRDLEVVIRKALERDPRDRYATAADFAADLDNVLHFRPIRARPPSLLDRTIKWIRRKPVHAALAGALIVAAPTTVWFGSRFLDQQRTLRRVRIAELWQDVNRLTRDDPDASLAICNEIISIDPRYAPAWGCRAKSYFNKWLVEREIDPEEAERLQTESLAGADRFIALQPTRAAPLKLKAFFLEQAGADPVAVQQLRDAAEQHYRGDEEDLFSDARQAYYEGDHAKAENLCSKVLSIRPRDDAREFRAMSRSRLGHWKEALEDLLLLEKVDGDDPYPRREAGKAYSNLQQFEEAEGELARALAVDPEDALAHEYLSRNSLDWARVSSGEAALERFRDAERHARAALRIDDDLPSSRLNLGVSLIEQYRRQVDKNTGLLDEAISLFREARDAASRSLHRTLRSDASTNLCDALIEAESFEEALPVCTEVTELRPTWDVGHYNLAGVYARTGRTEEALAALETDLRLGDTEHEWLRNDPWFESLREDPRFRKIVEEMRSNAEVGSAP